MTSAINLFRENGVHSISGSCPVPEKMGLLGTTANRSLRSFSKMLNISPRLISRYKHDAMSAPSPALPKEIAMGYHERGYTHTKGSTNVIVFLSLLDSQISLPRGAPGCPSCRR